MADDSALEPLSPAQQQAQLVENCEKLLAAAKEGRLHMLVVAAAIMGKNEDGHLLPNEADILAHDHTGAMLQYLEPISRTRLWKTLLAGFTQSVANVDLAIQVLEAERQKSVVTS